MYIMRWCYRIPLINLNWMNEIWGHVLMDDDGAPSTAWSLFPPVCSKHIIDQSILFQIKLGTSLRVNPLGYVSSPLRRHFISWTKLWSSGKGKDRQGMVTKRSLLLRAYIKVGCHPPTTHWKLHYTWLISRTCPGEAGGGKGRSVGSLWVTLGSMWSP